MKQLEHQHAVQAMVEERRRQYQEQKAREEAEIAAQSAEEVRFLLVFLYNLFEGAQAHTDSQRHQRAFPHSARSHLLNAHFVHKTHPLTCTFLLFLHHSQARKQVIIESQRQALLREAAELKDFLPRGVVRDQKDLEYLNQVLAGTQIS